MYRTQVGGFVREFTTNTSKPWLPPADEDSGHHDGPTSTLSTSMSSSNHGRQPSRLVLSQSKRFMFGGTSKQGLLLSPLSALLRTADTWSYFHVIGWFLPNQGHQSIIYGMPGGAGDFQVQGGDRSRLIMKMILWLGVIWWQHIERH